MIPHIMVRTYDLVIRLTRDECILCGLDGACGKYWWWIIWVVYVRNIRTCEYWVNITVEVCQTFKQW